MNVGGFIWQLCLSNEWCKNFIHRFDLLHSIIHATPTRQVWMEENIGFTSIRQQPYDDLDIKIQSITVDRCTHIVYNSNELIKQKQSKICFHF